MGYQEDTRDGEDVDENIGEDLEENFDQLMSRDPLDDVSDKYGDPGRSDP